MLFLLLYRIYHVVDDDLYIDFGHKFPCVCQRPRDQRRHQFLLGSEVLVKIKSLELSQRFLGYDKVRIILVTLKSALLCIRYLMVIIGDVIFM